MCTKSLKTRFVDSQVDITIEDKVEEKLLISVIVSCICFEHNPSGLK